MGRELDFCPPEYQTKAPSNLLPRSDHSLNDARRVELPGLPHGVVQDFTALVSQLVAAWKSVSTSVGMPRYGLFLSNLNNLVRAWFEVDVREDRLFKQAGNGTVGTKRWAAGVGLSILVLPSSHRQACTATQFSSANSSLLGCNVVRYDIELFVEDPLARMVSTCFIFSPCLPRLRSRSWTRNRSHTLEIFPAHPKNR